MAIKIISGDVELVGLAAEIHDACSSVDLDLTLTLRYSGDDDALPAAGALATSPAFFRRSNATVIVVKSEMEKLEAAEQRAVVLHEVGHACQPLGMSASEAEFDADLFACERGFLDALATNRRQWYARKGAAHGERYAAALSKWQDRVKALADLRHWYMLYLALT